MNSALTTTSSALNTPSMWGITTRGAVVIA